MEVRRQQKLLHLGDTAELIPIGEEDSDEEVTTKDLMDAILKIMASPNNPSNHTKTGVSYRDGRPRALEIVDVLRTITRKYATENNADLEARKNNTLIKKACFTSEERRRFNAMTSAPAIPANMWNLGLPT